MSSMGPLNLQDADLKGFEAIDPGRYNAEVFELKMDATKGGPSSKMPAGTPMIKVQFRLVSDAEGNTEGIANRRVFTQFVIPPKDYDPKKASVMKGMVARFFIALGDDESKVIGGKFDPMDDPEAYVGRECVVTLGKENKRDAKGNVIEDEFNNPVKGVKPAGSIGEAAVSGGIL